MILELINLEALFSLRLVGAVGTRHEKLRCRITDIRRPEHQGELVVQIVPDKAGALAASLALRRATDEYLVEPDADGQLRTGRTQISLRTYLFRLHRRLLKAWPKKSLQQEILEGLLDPTSDRRRDDGTKARWLQEAARWLQLEALRASVSTGQSAREFFLDVRRGLVANRKQLAHPLISQACPRTWKVELASGPNPASLLPGIHLAHAEAQSAAASTGGAAVSFLPLLEAALENHWRRMFQEDPQLSFVQGQNATAVSASVQTAAAMPAPPLDAASDGNENCGEGEEYCSIELRVPFFAPPQPEQDAHLCMAVVRVRAIAADRNLQKRLALLRRQLAFHLNDTQWSLEEFFRNHSLIVSPAQQLIFQDQHELHRWLTTSSEIEVEDRIRRLSKCWMRAGAPHSPLSGKAAMRRAVGQWLLQLQEPAVGKKTSIGCEQTPHTFADIDPQGSLASNAENLHLAAVPQSCRTAWVSITFPIWRRRKRRLFSAILSSLPLLAPSRRQRSLCIK